MVMRKTSVLVVMLLTCLLLSSCLGRISLESYLERLDEIRSVSDQAFARIKSSMESGSSDGSSTQALYRSVSQAEGVLAECEKRIKELKPPPAAAQLHDLVIQLYSESKGFFSEIKAMLEYSSEREPIVARVQTASRDLDTNIAANSSAAGSSSALSAAAGEVEGAKTELKGLKPPTGLKGVHDALLNMLTEYASSLRELASAVQGSDVNAINAAQAKVRAALSSNLDEETNKSIDAFNAGI